MVYVPDFSPPYPSRLHHLVGPLRRAGDQGRLAPPRPLPRRVDQGDHPRKTSFLIGTQLHLNLGRQERHDDLFEELDRVVVEARLQGVAEILLVAGFVEHGVEGLQGSGTATHPALGATGSDSVR
jgi:hypothetical protein